ncbi:MAG: biopolymer transporter ExbD [Myxococcales bacterium]|nr:biopolymer transporter ExbD [Myxococcales bacterium]
MAGGMDLGAGSGPGKKRSLDASLNLVPFIDLMAVTVVFLIMSAVWTQLGGLKVATAPPAPCGPDCATPEPPLSVAFTATTFTVSAGDVIMFTTPARRRANGRLELKELAAFLEAFKGQHATTTSLRLSPDDELAAADVVQVMDVATGAGFADLAFE